MIYNYVFYNIVTNFIIYYVIIFIVLSWIKPTLLFIFPVLASKEQKKEKTCFKICTSVMLMI